MKRIFLFIVTNLAVLALLSAVIFVVEQVFRLRLPRGGIARGQRLSRNNVWLAITTLAEGWHNNHHHYTGSVPQGFYWWEFDITF